MIDPKELRIGNWVLYDHGLKMKITQLTAFRAWGDCGFTVPCDIPYTDIEPIPLTEDILIKCGFDLLDKEFTKGAVVYSKDIYGNNSLDLTISKDGAIDASIANEFVLHFKADLGKIENLHSLQNLYFSLGGPWELGFKP